MAFNNLLVQDVCEVYLKDLSDTSKVYFFGLTSQAEITQQIQQDVIRGGIGNGVIGVMQSNKELTFKVTTLLHNEDVSAIQSGSAFGASTTFTVQKTESGVLTSGKITITGTPIGTNVLVYDGLGKKLEGTYATGDVTVTGGTEGESYTVVYSTSVTGEALSLDSKKFPKNYYVELHTIAYNPNSNEVVADLYYVFNKALPNGGLSQQFQAGQSVTDEVEFTCGLLTGSTEYGKYIVVPRIVA